MPFPVYEKQADIPKGFEDEYEEKDGKWHAIDRAAKLKESLEKEREKREAAEATAKKAAKDALKAQAEADASKAGLTDAQLQKIRDDAKAAAEAEFAPTRAEAEKATAENRTLKLNNVVKGLFGAAKILAAKQDDMWKLHGDEFDLTADGKPMVKADPAKDVAKHVAALAKARPEWVEGTKASGGGAAGVTKVADGGAADQVGKIDPTQRLRAAHEAGATV